MTARGALAGLGRAVAALAALGLGLGMVALAGAGLVAARLGMPGPATAPTRLVVAPGTGAADLAAKLGAAEVIADPWLFRLAARARGVDRDLRAGEYRFPARATPRRVLAILESGKTVSRALTLPEGLSSFAIVDRVRQAQGLVGPVRAIPPEGALWPETWHYEWGTRRQALIARMKAARAAALADLWAGRAEGLPLDRPEQAVILASIVEKETGLAGERPKVAAVFHNRLERGMRLQSDPTVIYGITRGRRALGRPLTRADLEADTPYNTYRHAGLPPGPIANPGRAALEAVLHPAEHDFLYFVADGTGGHAFAETLAEHNRNVARWRARE